MHRGGAVARFALHAGVEDLVAVHDPGPGAGHVAANALLLLVVAAEPTERAGVLRLRPRVVDRLMTRPAALGPGVARWQRRRRTLRDRRGRENSQSEHD